MQRGFVAVQHDQLSRMPTVDLPAKLRSDRSASAGYQNPLACQVAGDGCDVGVDLATAKQVRYVDVADVFDPHPSGQEIIDAGENFHCDVGICRNSRYLTQEGGISAG